MKNKFFLTAILLVNLVVLGLFAMPPGDPPQLDKCITTGCDTSGTGCLAANAGTGGSGPPDLPHPHDPFN